MPGLSGLDLQDRLIAMGYCIPIIFLTGHPNENVRIRAMKTGAVAFLSKPCNGDHLLGYLEQASPGSWGMEGRPTSGPVACLDIKDVMKNKQADRRG